MSEPGPHNSLWAGKDAGAPGLRLYLRILGVMLLMALAAAAGLWLGGRSGRKLAPDEPPPARAGPAKNDQTAPEHAAAAEPPLYFFANTRGGADLQLAAEEMALAARAGVRRVCLTMPLTWPGESADPAALTDRLRIVNESNPEARILFYLVLDPPFGWLEKRPSETMHADGKAAPFASVASVVWLADAQAAFDVLHAAITVSEQRQNVEGFVIAALESGQWYHSGGYDTSEANTAAFRAWLTHRYTDDSALRQSWGDAKAALSTATIPERPVTSDPLRVFFPLPKLRRNVDYLHFVSDSTADAIAAMTAHIKKTAGRQTQVWAPYGFSFDFLKNDAGHFSLIEILDSDIDGFISPVSYLDRGLGGTGGYMGPVDSARFHQKQWRILDDMRTGIARNPATGAIERMKGMRVEDVYAMQARNFAGALTRGLGLVWADTEADGRLHDEEMWKRFSIMREQYQRLSSKLPEQDGSPSAEEPDSVNPLERPTLTVVVDEASRFYQQCDEKLNALLLSGARDSAIRCGVPAQFCLLRDVVEDRAAPSAVYLFCNAFLMPEEDRRRLHAILAREKATAIWLYAPGYINETTHAAGRDAGAPRASTEAIGATVRMTVKAFEGPAAAGSQYALTGPWLESGEAVGADGEWQPLFYVDDKAANAIAHYRVSRRVSVAFKALPDEGWTSIYVADPYLSPALLREILLMLEQQVYFRRTHGKTFDAAYFGPGIIAMHAGEAGERLIDLGAAHDVRDLLNPEKGWLNKHVFNVVLEAGETRIFRLTPVTKGTVP